MLTHFFGNSDGPFWTTFLTLKIFMFDTFLLTKIPKFLSFLKTAAEQPFLSGNRFGNVRAWLFLDAYSPLPPRETLRIETLHTAFLIRKFGDFLGFVLAKSMEVLIFFQKFDLL